MRQIYPTTLDPVDPESVYADLPDAEGRPGVRINMVASVDGATAVDGVSGPLSGPPDRVVYRLLRSLADVVLVAAGTARTENYGPARVYDEYVHARRQRGQADAPRIAVVTRRLDLDWNTPLFRDVTEPTIVIAPTDAAPDRLTEARRAAELITAGTGDVDLRAAVVALGERGLSRVLAEGGPSLNGALVAAGLVDEVCLTISPRLAGGDAKRILAGPPLPGGIGLELRSLLEDDGFLLARYRRPRSAPPG